MHSKRVLAEHIVGTILECAVMRLPSASPAKKTPRLNQVTLVYCTTGEYFTKKENLVLCVFFDNSGF
jgi:hypothetical protein